MNAYPNLQGTEGTVTYQASSPDEVALVEWAGWAGLSLAKRTLTHITLAGRHNKIKSIK